MSGVRDNPPASVVEPEELEMYVTLYDDITRDGKSLQYQDRHALADLAITLVEMTALRADIRLNGVMMEVSGDRGNVTKRNGSCDVLDRRITSVHRLMKAFGMAPEFRPKATGTIPLENKDDKFGEI